MNLSGSDARMLAALFVRGETTGGPEPSCEVVGRSEVGELRSQLVVGFGVEAFDGGLSDRAAHPFDLAGTSWAVGPGQPVLDLADHV